MRRVVVDTNVLISFVTDRDPEQQERASSLLEAAGAGQLEIILHQICIVELQYVLQNLYHVPAAEVAAIIADLLAHPGMAAVHEVDWGKVLRLWPSAITAFADAVIATVGQSYGAVATFDKGLGRRLCDLGVEVVRSAP